MFRLSKKMLFAIEAVLDIAYHAGAQPVQSRDVTRRQGIPRRYLEQALQALVRENLLIGVRGPRGGYRLARERRRISVADIVRVVQKMETDQPGAEDVMQSELGRKVVSPLGQEVAEQMIRKLETVTIEDLCIRADQEGVKSEGRQSLDFSI